MIYGLREGMRSGTQVKRWVINFCFNQGGMGDFVNYSAATVFVARTQPWVEGRLFVPRYLKELMEHIHNDFENFEVFASEDASKFLEHGTSIICPELVLGGKKSDPQFLSCLGAHPFDVGFAYYSNVSPPPATEKLPVLDLARRAEIPPGVKYAVVTTGNQSPARRVTGKHLNPVIDHLKERDILPVFLGKSDLLMDGKTTTTFPDDIKWSAGLDLRDKTTVLAAAAIMQHAEMTLGLDNGLLHLAALMKDSKIIFGYNITTVAHREPRRDHGITMNLAVTEKDIACAQCQSKWRNFPEHKFDRCFYGDNACVNHLFRDDAIRWKDAIDMMIARNEIEKSQTLREGLANG